MFLSAERSDGLLLPRSSTAEGSDAPLSPRISSAEVSDDPLSSRSSSAEVSDAPLSSRSSTADVSEDSLSSRSSIAEGSEATLRPRSWGKKWRAAAVRRGDGASLTDQRTVPLIFTPERLYLLICSDEIEIQGRIEGVTETIFAKLLIAVYGQISLRSAILFKEHG